MNVLQGLAVTEIKKIADSLLTETPSADGKTVTLTANTTSEAVRTALQALVGCAGAAAGGGSCTSAASGAAASVVLNALINSATGQDSTTFVNGAAPDPKSLADQQARTALIATLVGAISTAAGLNAQSAVNAAVIETERNGLSNSSRPRGTTLPGRRHNGDPNPGPMPGEEVRVSVMVKR